MSSDDTDGDRRTRDDRRPPSFSDQHPELYVLEAEPENAQAASRETFRHLLTPRESHYVRNHYPTPEIDAEEWTVSLTGTIDEAELSMADLEGEYPTESVALTMECSGNGRSAFDPTAGEHQWTYGAVSTAAWTGTPVRAVLEAHDADLDAGWLAVMGGDAPDGEDVFCRSIPMEKALEDCVLAYEMNGAPLPPEHGYPVRLAVPGWFGNNSVKWVERLCVMDSMVAGPEWDGTEGRRYTEYQQDSYRIVPDADEEPTRYESIDVFDTHEQFDAVDRIENAYMYDQLVNSLVVSPADGATIDAGGDVPVDGVAWAGDDPVDAVAVSTDGGETWHDAELFAPALGPDAWRRFRYVWEPEPGEHVVASRARNAAGRRQPLEVAPPEAGLRGIEDDRFPWNRKGYGNDAALSYAVTVTVE